MIADLPSGGRIGGRRSRSRRRLSTICQQQRRCGQIPKSWQATLALSLELWWGCLLAIWRLAQKGLRLPTGGCVEIPPV